jgi:hypothetical protein
MQYRFPASLWLAAISLSAADPALTIYNQNFAVVRETVPLDLKPGVNHVRHVGLTSFAEPDSVILRDPAGKVALQILEQNYLADPVSMDVLLAFYEGKTIDFQTTDGKIVSGRIVRAGLTVPPGEEPQMIRAKQALVESEGKLRFGLPGTPLFPALTRDSILRPTLDWVVRTDRAARLDAELAYLSGGLNWKADYNVVASDDNDAVELLGWVTIDNRSGKSFANSTIALMAGEVNKLLPMNGRGNCRDISR